MLAAFGWSTHKHCMSAWLMPRAGYWDTTFGHLIAGAFRHLRTFSGGILVWKLWLMELDLRFSDVKQQHI